MVGDLVTHKYSRVSTIIVGKVRTKFTLHDIVAVSDKANGDHDGLNSELPDGDRGFAAAAFPVCYAE